MSEMKDHSGLHAGPHGLTTDQCIGIGTEQPQALLDIRSPGGAYDPQRRDWPAPSQLHISPACDDDAGAYIGSKTENHFYAAAGIRRHGKGEWEVLSDLGAGITSCLDGYHSFFCLPPGMKGAVLNPSAWIRMRLDNDGNLGLGTLSPTERLDVRGTIRCDDVRCPRTAVAADAAATSADPDPTETVSLPAAVASLQRTVAQLQQELAALRSQLPPAGDSTNVPDTLAK